jgi:phenylpyruvate tautomerase PptA (4-oxalocrotonate tautomerase family)
MPVITIDGPALSVEKKEKLAREITKLSSELTNIPADAFVILFNEYPYESIAQGGILISEKLKQQK